MGLARPADDAALEPHVREGARARRAGPARGALDRAPSATNGTGSRWTSGSARRPATRDARSMLRLMVEGLFTVEPGAGLAALLSLVRALRRKPRGALGRPRTARRPSTFRAACTSSPGAWARSCTITSCSRRRSTAIAQDASGVTVDVGRRASGAAARAIVAVPLPLTAPHPLRARRFRRGATRSRSARRWARSSSTGWRTASRSGARSGWSARSRATGRRPTASSTPRRPTPASACSSASSRPGTALALTGRPMEERRKLVVARVAELLGPEGADAIDYVDNDWPAEPWTRGCYGANMGPGVLTTLGPVAARAVRPRSTGRAPRRPPCGRDTSRARSGRASARRPK